MITRLAIVALCVATIVRAATDDIDVGKPHGMQAPEDNIPVIEIKGEGKPMTAAQIRALEEATDGPQDIKLKHTWKPAECPRSAKRKDFITLQYKAYLEDGKKFHQSYGNEGPLRFQLGTGMTIPGLDKGMKGMCATELRKVSVPYRLSRKRKSRTWKYLPNDEHWLVFDVEMLDVKEWTPDAQFEWFDANNDTFLTARELTKHVDTMHRSFGKHWHNEDIDTVLAVNYFIKYFDANDDSKVDLKEYVTRMNVDLSRMNSIKSKPKGRRRDPDVAWILDFNNDGIVTQTELDEAPERLDQSPPVHNAQHTEL